MRARDVPGKSLGWVRVRPAGWRAEKRAIRRLSGRMAAKVSLNVRHTGRNGAGQEAGFCPALPAVQDCEARIAGSRLRMNTYDVTYSVAQSVYSSRCAARPVRGNLFTSSIPGRNCPPLRRALPICSLRLRAHPSTSPEGSSGLVPAGWTNARTNGLTMVDDWTVKRR